MADQPRTSKDDPAEGSREVVERELQRTGRERKPGASEKRPLERASEWKPHTRAMPARRRDSSRQR
jgi:hypothetical protein